MSKFVLRRLSKGKILKRIAMERLCEPLHLNIASVFVYLFGSFRAKIAFDLVVRQQHAFCLLEAADLAVKQGIDRLTVIEFGVANGAGLLNICAIAKRVTRETGVEFDIVGFDTGKGMPPAVDYRDHPDLYGAGDFPLQDRDQLLARLPENAKILFGDVSSTLGRFLESDPAPIGFVSFDLDYYSSTKDALGIFAAADPSAYLPTTLVYIDDIQFREHNAFCGEFLAINEFNQEPILRRITPYNFLRKRRIFTRALWVDQIFVAHVLDHAARSGSAKPKANMRVLDNPYLATG